MSLNRAGAIPREGYLSGVEGVVVRLHGGAEELQSATLAETFWKVLP
jgi:hypothetical protein